MKIDFKKIDWWIVIRTLIIVSIMSAIIFIITSNQKSEQQDAKEKVQVATEELEESESEVPKKVSVPVPGPSAVFKKSVNNALYKYYPLSVGTKWVYEDWTYYMREGTAWISEELAYHEDWTDNLNSERDASFIKELSKYTITVSKIYEENGKEYVELNREIKITNWFEVDINEGWDNASNPEIKTLREVSIPADKELVYNSTAVLEISGTTVKYLYPEYPDYVDSFPLKVGILLDLRPTDADWKPWQSGYGEEILIWKREKTDNYVIKTNGKVYKNCYRSFAYDLRGSSGSRDEIVFCEGIGPVKYVSELISYPHHSYYDNLIDFKK